MNRKIILPFSHFSKFNASLLTFCFLLFTYFASSQTAPDKYFVQFTDKNNSPYSISNPQQFLSQRAIQRRLNQNIPIVENDLPVNPSYVATIQTLGATVLTQSKWFNAVTIFTTNQSVLDTISHLPFVSQIQKMADTKNMNTSETDYNKFSLFSNPAIVSKNHSKTNDILDYGGAYNQIHQLNGQELHNQGYQGHGMIISVIDAGFNNANIITAFDSLWQNNRILGTFDFVNPGNNVFQNTHNHGMNVLSIIAGNIPGQIVGSAPGADFWLLRSEDGATEYLIEEDNWVAAAEFADSAGTDVINTSLGYTTFTDSTQNHTYADMDGQTTRISIGVNIASSKGILVVVSAGNAGSAAWHYITTPGDADSALTCGAIDSLGVLAGFSSVGPASDGGLKPNVVAMGRNTTYVGSDGNVYEGNGTSFSAPLISGLSACLWQAYPQYTNVQIKHAIEQSSSQYLTPDFEKGYGIPNFGMASQILHQITSKIESLTRTYPNPFTNKLTIEFYSPDSQKVTFEILSLMGVCVYSKIYNFNSNSYNKFMFEDIKNLPQGTYILKATTKNKIYTQKIIKVSIGN